MTNLSKSEGSDEGEGRFDWNALFDAIIIIAVLVAVKQFFLLYTIKYAGPISTFTAMAVATWRLRAGSFMSGLGSQICCRKFWRTAI